MLLDTHIWIWLVQGDPRLDVSTAAALDQSSDKAVSVISLWEVAKAVELGRLSLALPIKEWIELATVPPSIAVLPLSTEVIVESTQLPGSFHKDPFDQLIVATARIYDATLVTVDARIRAYQHVNVR